MVIQIDVRIRESSESWFIEPIAKSQIEITTDNSSVAGAGVMVESLLAGVIQQYNAVMLAKKEEVVKE